MRWMGRNLFDGVQYLHAPKGTKDGRTNAIITQRRREEDDKSCGWRGKKEEEDDDEEEDEEQKEEGAYTLYHFLPGGADFHT